MDISALRDRAAPSEMTVAELNEYIKNIFDGNRLLSSVTVKGEISNFTNHRSGHLYFSLKDSDAQIRCVMFRSAASRLKFLPENGMKVIAHGSVSVFVRDGGYQLYVNSLQPDGIGALYLAYEQLKEKLFSEGLFSDEAKKPIPRFPRAIGVITSPTGAAVRDIINVTRRRYPLSKIYIYPALVQGDGAVDSLIKAIDYFDFSGLVDTVIIGRGGGSIEDLWAFNSERLARRIFDMSVPVISAVGHETDFTICDFVSDLRAPTPSAAAELAVPDIREIFMLVSEAEERMAAALINSCTAKREKLSHTEEKLYGSLKGFLEFYGHQLSEAYSKLSASVEICLNNKKTDMRLFMEKLNALSPLSVLSRGYTLTEHNGEPVVNSSELSENDIVTIRFSDGKVKAQIKEKNI